MASIPPRRPRLSESDPRDLRDVAQSFGTDAERYDRARPRYPDDLVARIVAAMPGREALDVGCGTGIFARQLQAAGCQVLGLDPDARMAEVARRFGLEVEVATIEAWDPAGREFDAVVAAQAWHWIDPVAGTAKAAQALRPGGLLAVFWNAAQPPDDLARAFAAISSKVLPGVPSNWMRNAADGYATLCAKAGETIGEAGGFGEPEQWRFERDQHYSTAEWLDVLPTQGFITSLPPEQVTELQAQVGAAIDAAGGGFPMQYTTVAVAAVRSGPQAGRS